MPVVYPWTRDFISWGLSVSICEMGRMKEPTSRTDVRVHSHNSCQVLISLSGIEQEFYNCHSLLPFCWRGGGGQGEIRSHSIFFDHSLVFSKSPSFRYPNISKHFICLQLPLHLRIDLENQNKTWEAVSCDTIFFSWYTDYV